MTPYYWTTNVRMCVYICIYVCMYVCMCIYVTGFWKTDQIVTLGLSILLTQLVATLIHYIFTVPVSGLVD